MLAKTLARSIDASVRRIQFTPDLLPSDVTGVSIFNQDARRFEFRPGAIFANVVVGDEINRASPKTQSALLESMEERQVTVDGTTYALQAPFIVMATQNPIEMEGTYPLPEAQRDRFMARISMGYPSPRGELTCSTATAPHSPLEDLSPVTDADTDQPVVAGRHAGPRQPGACGSTSSTSSHGRPARPRPCAWAPRRVRACTCSGRPGPRPPSRAATTSSPTTSSHVASPSSSHRLMPSSETQLARRTDRRGRHRPATAACRVPASTR